MIRCQELTKWTPPNEGVYVVSHYGVKTVDAGEGKLEIAGFVKRPATFTLAEIKRRPRRDIMATLECGGNGSSPAFMGAVANVRWTGTPLAPLLKECGLQPRGIEVVFFGADQKKEKVRELEFDMRFSRSLALGDALRQDLMLCWEMNGQPL